MEGYLNLQQAAEYLGYSPSGLRKLVDRSRKLMQHGGEPELRFAQGRKRGKVLFRREWLDDFAREVVEVRVAPVTKRRKAPKIPTNSTSHGLDWSLLN